MISRTPYTVARGAPLRLFIQATSGDPTTITPTKCSLKVINGPNDPIPDETVAASGFMTIGALNTASTPPGWPISLSSASSSALAVGYYVADLSFAVGSDTDVTNSVTIQVVNAVSLP